MDSYLVLIAAGFAIGTLGTLIGAGGGFILVPVLLLTHPSMPPDIVTAISIAIVAANALSGSIAYARAGRIDYKAGLLFAGFTIPGSILGVKLTRYISPTVFSLIFGCLLVVLAIFLFMNHTARPLVSVEAEARSGWKKRQLTDHSGETYVYHYNQAIGILISVLVGFISPLLGIGGGIIHVPALVRWLHFPVHVATATSHFILAIMSIVSVVIHWQQGSYHEPAVQHLVIGLGIGVVAGAQLGAWLSHRIHGHIIVRSLAVCLALVGVRVFLQAL